jgi:hypothetical protein
MSEIKLFKRWLTKNINKFNYKPIITNEAPDKLYFHFEGIIDSIECILCEHWIDIWYNHSEEGVDLLCEIDMPELKMAKDELYYCNTCTEQKLYGSVDELYADHTFKYLLDWVNEIEQEDYIRVMDGGENHGIFCAELKNRKRDWTWEGIEPVNVPLVKNISKNMDEIM